MPAKKPPVPLAAKVDAVRRVRIGGEPATAVAQGLGVDRRQIYRWEAEEEVQEALRALQLPPSAPEPVREMPTDTPLITDLDLKRLVEAVRDGMRPDRAMQKIRRHPKTWKLWQERAEKGDEECRRVVDMLTTAFAELEQACMRTIRKGEMGWQGPAWLAVRHWPEVYSEDAAAADAAGEHFSQEDLLEVLRAGGVI